MGKCVICHRQDKTISEVLQLCSYCIKRYPDKALPIAETVHKLIRRRFGLPAVAPKDNLGVECGQCVNKCKIPKDGIGYCGIKENKADKIKGTSSIKGKLSWYHDFLPTNCVSDWVCPGGTEAGYPEFSVTAGPEKGFKNLAVFFHSCTFNCLYCQNWHFRQYTLKPRSYSVEDLVKAVDDRTTCICFFGGDPASQMPFALKASKEALKNRRDKPLRICWESNGSMNRGLLKEMLRLSMETGGVIKFDLKAYNNNLHLALTGVTNERTLENFAYIGNFFSERPSVPILVASTLLVPGYVEEEEVRAIAKFISSINKDIPYTLLGFFPHYYMNDLPLLDWDVADKCKKAALEEGLRKVKISNIHLFKNR